MADLTLSGCTTIDKELYYLTRFNIGIFAYVIEDANEGVLTKIFIKNVNFNSKSIVYTDTFNEIWLETELCTIDEAKALAIQFFQNELNNLPDCQALR